jgi:hypothetical protein
MSIDICYHIMGFEQHCAPKSTQAVKEVSHASPPVV